MDPFPEMLNGENECSPETEGLQFMFEKAIEASKAGVNIFLLSSYNGETTYWGTEDLMVRFLQNQPITIPADRLTLYSASFSKHGAMLSILLHEVAAERWSRLQQTSHTSSHSQFAQLLLDTYEDHLKTENEQKSKTVEISPLRRTNRIKRPRQLSPEETASRASRPKRPRKKKPVSYSPNSDTNELHTKVKETENIYQLDADKHCSENPITRESHLATMIKSGEDETNQFSIKLEEEDFSVFVQTEGAEDSCAEEVTEEYHNEGDFDKSSRDQQVDGEKNADEDEEDVSYNAGLDAEEEWQPDEEEKEPRGVYKSVGGKQIKQHKKQVHGVCSLCGNTFNVLRRTSRSPAPFAHWPLVCSSCHEENSQSVICPFCQGSHIFSLAAYREHASRVCKQSLAAVPDDLKLYLKICTHCSQVYKSAARLKQHQATCGSLNKKRFTCDVCSKTFCQKNNLKAHMNSVHLGLLDHVCDECNKAFPSAHTLNNHRRRVHSTVRHQCQFCSRQFKSPEQLKTHEMDHTGEKPHPCLSCNKRFKSNYQLKIHTRTHTGELPYVCTVCGSRFAKQSNMRDHERAVHSTDRTFFCSLCHKGFLRRDYCERHQQSCRAKGLVQLHQEVTDVKTTLQCTVQVLNYQHLGVE